MTEIIGRRACDYADAIYVRHWIDGRFQTVTLASLPVDQQLLYVVRWMRGSERQRQNEACSRR